MSKKPQEWLKQAEYDIEVAEAMFEARKYIYTVFMCHLSVEKALKGLYVKVLKEEPPKVHNLILLLEKIELEMPADLYEFVVEINRLSIATRYPDDLQRMMKDYNKNITGGMVKKSREVLKWLKKQY
ncbi:MAG: HEPN domain-containing protein [bacterium]